MCDVTSTSVATMYHSLSEWIKFSRRLRICSASNGTPKKGRQWAESVDSGYIALGYPNWEGLLDDLQEEQQEVAALMTSTYLQFCGKEWLVMGM